MEKSSIIIDKWEVPTQIESIENCNSFEVEAGTNGCHGGDSGHGCRTYLRISDIASSDVRFESSDNKKTLEVYLGGDSELQTFIETLEFAAQTLREMQYGKKDVRTRAQRTFAMYLRDIVELYRDTKSLRGMSEISKKYAVSAITRDQFYQMELHKSLRGDVSTDHDFCNAAYDYVLGKTDVMPIYGE